MNTTSLLPALICAAIIPGTTTRGGPRSGGSFSVPADAIDAGGVRASSPAYIHDGSIGGIGGIGAVPAVALTVKHGYTGQLYDAAGLQIIANDAVPESESLQLAAALVMDDGSTLSLDPSVLPWSASSSRFMSIDAAGLATAGNVFTDTEVNVRSHFAEFMASRLITVKNTGRDDYQLYAGDGLDDAWQVAHFGEENPAAFPSADPDADGQDNLFEYNASLEPDDPLSRFDIETFPQNGTRRDIRFGPVVPGRSYTLMFSTDLDLWEPVPAPLPIDDVSPYHILQDPQCIEARKFYRIDITPP